MAGENTVVRTIHDLTQAAWFGGSLMGAVAIDAAAGTIPDARGRVRAADAAWSAWQPISTTAIAAHLVAGLGMTWANKGRLVAQSGVMTTNLLKAGLTLAAVAADANARRLGREISEQQPASVPGSASPAPSTPSVVEAARRRLRATQWTLVGLTGALVVVGARMGEQQRPRGVLAGVGDRLRLGA